MSKKSNTSAALSSRGASVTIGLVFGIGLLLSGGCEKAEQPRSAPQPAAAHVLNAQENVLVGHWHFQRKETYEVSGIDSAGNCLCDLINSAQADSLCEITFFNTGMGAGSIGGCDENAAFRWSVPQPVTLQTNNTLYHIEYLCIDSIALSVTYVKDILQLKDIFFYRRK